MGDQHIMRMWRNWQTRWLQVPVGATPWRFESSHPHLMIKPRNFCSLGLFYLGLESESTSTAKNGRFVRLRIIVLAGSSNRHVTEIEKVQHVSLTCRTLQHIHLRLSDLFCEAFR